MGRRKGIPNRKTKIFCDLLSKNNIDIIYELCKIIKEKDTPPALRATILLDLMNYQYPKQRALSVTGEDGEPVSFNLQFAPEGKKREVESR